MMQSLPPRSGTAPAPQLPGQLSFEDLSETGRWILHRLSIGDELVICDDGSWILRDPPGAEPEA